LERHLPDDRPTELGEKLDGALSFHAEIEQSERQHETDRVEVGEARLADGDPPKYAGSQGVRIAMRELRLDLAEELVFAPDTDQRLVRTPELQPVRLHRALIRPFETYPEPDLGEAGRAAPIESVEHERQAIRS